jgi:hypothetical protein
MVVSWLLARWLLFFGKNLHVYGIDSRDILCDNQKNRQDVEKEHSYDSIYQNNIRIKIEELVEQAKNEKDPYIADILDRRLRALSNELNEDDQKYLAVDDLIQNLREQRRVNQSYDRGSYNFGYHSGY